MAEPTSAKTIGDLVLAVAEFAGISSYGAGTDEAMVPTNRHDRTLCLRIVNDAIKKFILDGPKEGWRWQRRIWSKQLSVVTTGTATSGSAATLVDSGLAGTYANNYYTDCILEITAGVGIGQWALVTGYTGASGTFAFSALSGGSTPTTTSEYAVGHRYKLPDNFGTADGKITYGRDVNHGREIDWTDESEIRRLQENSVTTGYPYLAATRAYDRRKYELMLWPDPIAADIVSFPYSLHFDKAELEAGIATAAGATSITDSTLANMYANDYFNGWIITVMSGPGKTGYAVVTDYTGTTGKFDFAALSNTMTPTTASYYKVEPANQTHPAGFQFDYATVVACKAEAMNQIEGLSGPWANEYPGVIAQSRLINNRMAPKKLGTNNLNSRRLYDRDWKPVDTSGIS